jgi:charged multivesicular body protein 6
MGCFVGMNSATDESDSRVKKDEKDLAEVMVTRDKVRMYVRKLEKGIEHCQETARQLLREKKKDKALLAIRKKKYQENLLEST